MTTDGVVLTADLGGHHVVDTESRLSTSVDDVVVVARCSAGHEDFLRLVGPSYIS
jgi:hypothetical protein